MLNRWNITKLLKKYTVKIPEIQRDYAQGRKLDEVNQIREKLLGDIFDVLCHKEDSLALNYIYGVPDKQEIVLIDGQQRITTLFLLKFYLSIRADEKGKEFLGRLNYATRATSKAFCVSLGKFEINNADVPANEKLKISAKIKDDTKFKKKWLNDPTVVNMLNMLDAIDEKYSEVCVGSELCKDMYSRLDNIEFSFVSLDGFKRTEELYSAMNSRGKKLTEFEILKGKLLKINGSRDLPGNINDKWIPDFWKLSQKAAKNTATADEFAPEKHDEYLCNYFMYILQMLWFEIGEKPDEKNGCLPNIETMLDEVCNDFPDKEILQAHNIEALNNATGRTKFLNFAMDIVTLFTTEAEDYKAFLEDFSKVENDDAADNAGSDIFKACYLNENFTNRKKCHLWAFIKYEWDKKHNKTRRRSVKDYAILVQSLFIDSATNTTPQSVDKTSLKDHVLWKVTYPFNAITEGKATGDLAMSSQCRVFMLLNDKKYSMLNNKFVRGCTENISEVLLHKTDKEREMFSMNLNWLLKMCAEKQYMEIFKKLDACELSEIRFSRYQDMVFIPATENIFKSLLSIKGWKSDPDFGEFIKIMCTADLQHIPVANEYDTNEWKYYVSYDSFCGGSKDVGQFNVSSADKYKMGFNAIHTIGERATKHQRWSPFEYEIYQRSMDNKIFNGNRFVDFKERYGIEFEKNDRGFVWKCNLEAQPFECTGDKDIIEEFWEHFKELVRQMDKNDLKANL